MNPERVRQNAPKQGAFPEGEAMRLIDADALLVELDEWENTEENSDRALGVVDAKVIACQMSTVDAIPVEWIQNLLTEMGDDSPYRPAVEWLLITYRMEKED